MRVLIKKRAGLAQRWQANMVMIGYYLTVLPELITRALNDIGTGAWGQDAALATDAGLAGIHGRT